MSEAEKKKGAPTPKMVEAAKKAAERQGVKLPKDFATNFDVCKAFLDEHLTKPSPKAVAFAEKIAKEKGVELTAEARVTGQALSAWIDANK